MFSCKGENTMTAMIILLVVLVLLGLFAISVYNGLVVARQRVQEAWSTVDTQLKRRYDLVPNLIEMVKGYMKHEKETFEKVVQARNSAMSITAPAEKGKAETVLNTALKSVFALAESYPELKANEGFMKLHQTLEDTETKIQAARQFYNSVVLTLNTRVEMFPNNIFANMFHFEKAAFFELDEDEAKEARKAVKVQF